MTISHTKTSLEHGKRRGLDMRRPNRPGAALYRLGHRNASYHGLRVNPGLVIRLYTDISVISEMPGPSEAIGSCRVAGPTYLFRRPHF